MSYPTYEHLASLEHQQAWLQSFRGMSSKEALWKCLGIPEDCWVLLKLLSIEVTKIDEHWKFGPNGAMEVRLKDFALAVPKAGRWVQWNLPDEPPADWDEYLRGAIQACLAFEPLPDVR